MAKRNLHIIRRVKNVPVLGICEFCNMQFPARQPAGDPASAQAGIQQQFNAHKCKPLEVSEGAAATGKV